MHPFLGAQTDIPAPKVPLSSIWHWSGKMQFEPYGPFKFLFHFLIFLANFDQQTIQFDLYCPFKNFINSSFYFKHSWKRNQEQSGLTQVALLRFWISFQQTFQEIFWNTFKKFEERKIWCYLYWLFRKANLIWSGWTIWKTKCFNSYGLFRKFWSKQFCSMCSLVREFSSEDNGVLSSCCIFMEFLSKHNTA